MAGALEHFGIELHQEDVRQTVLPPLPALPHDGGRGPVLENGL